MDFLDVLFMLSGIYEMLLFLVLLANVFIPIPYIKNAVYLGIGLLFFLIWFSFTQRSVQL
jgi:hypothetical protein